MARREYRHALADMLDAIAVVETATVGKSFDDFETDRILKYAVQRAIEIISEASRALPDDVRALQPDVPWPEVRAIGNVLRHEYEGLSDPIIWRVVTDELPRLKASLELIQASVARRSG